MRPILFLAAVMLSVVALAAVSPSRSVQERTEQVPTLAPQRFVAEPAVAGNKITVPVFAEVAWPKSRFPACENGKCPDVPAMPNILKSEAPPPPVEGTVTEWQPVYQTRYVRVGRGRFRPIRNLIGWIRHRRQPVPNPTPIPIPDPIPDPQPQPEPQPPVQATRWLIAVHESGEATVQQRKVWQGVQTLAACKANGYERRLVDDDNPAADLRPWVQRAKSRPYAFIADTGGTILWEGPWPATDDEMAALILKHGGQ
jgi:hypothetical protein